MLRNMHKYIRNMRKKRPIDALFPKARRDILAATYGQPEQWWYLSELAQQLNTTPSSLQRELQSLVSSGILRQRKDGRRTYFQAEAASPIFGELQGIIFKTLGIEKALKEVLSKFGDRLACAFLYGSVARQQEHTLSDVDLMVIGSIGLSELSPTCYSPKEFQKKVKAENHFLMNVLRGEKTFLKGDERELENLAGKPDRAAA